VVAATDRCRKAENTLHLDGYGSCMLSDAVLRDSPIGLFEPFSFSLLATERAVYE